MKCYIICEIKRIADKRFLQNGKKQTQNIVTLKISEFNFFCYSTTLK